MTRSLWRALNQLTTLGADAALAELTLDVIDADGLLHIADGCREVRKPPADHTFAVTARQYLSEPRCVTCDEQWEPTGPAIVATLDIAAIHATLLRVRETLDSAVAQADAHGHLPRTEHLAQAYQIFQGERANADQVRDVSYAYLRPAVDAVVSMFDELDPVVSALPTNPRWRSALEKLVCEGLLTSATRFWGIDFDATATLTVVHGTVDSVNGGALELLASYLRRRAPETRILVCPRFVAEWLLRNLAAGTTERCVLTAPVDGVAPDVVDLAIGLWQIETPGPLNSPKHCLAAAQALRQPR